MSNTLRHLVLAAINAVAQEAHSNSIAGEEDFLALPQVQAALAKIDEEEQAATRWRKIRPWLGVEHMYDAGRLGVAGKSIARVRLGSGLSSESLCIETPGNGQHGPAYTVEQVVDSQAVKR